MIKLELKPALVRHDRRLYTIIGRIDKDAGENKLDTVMHFRMEIKDMGL
jgi:hypothetical protein